MRLGIKRKAAAITRIYRRRTQSLNKAPAINHTALRACKFDAAVIKRVEDYLPYVSDIRLAFTPWIVGEEFCRKVLKIPAAKLQNPRFSLLTQLGFSASDIAAANAWCYGHAKAKNAPGLSAQQATVFACADEISAEAHIHMAASVQPFISGDVGLSLSLPENIAAERVEKLLLSIWRQGVKAVTIDYEAPPLKRKNRKSARVALPKCQGTCAAHTQVAPESVNQFGERFNKNEIKSHASLEPLKTAPAAPRAVRWRAI